MHCDYIFYVDVRGIQLVFGKNPVVKLCTSTDRSLLRSVMEFTVRSLLTGTVYPIQLSSQQYRYFCFGLCQRTGRTFVGAAARSAISHVARLALHTMRMDIRLYFY